MTRTLDGLRASLVAAASFLAACGPDYGGLAIEVQGGEAAGDVVTARNVQLALGRVVRVHARPRSLTSRSYEDPDRFDLAVKNENVGRVFRDPEEWHFVIVGRLVGTSCMQVLLDNDEEECIPFTVRAEGG